MRLVIGCFLAVEINLWEEENLIILTSPVSYFFLKKKQPLSEFTSLTLRADLWALNKWIHPFIHSSIHLFHGFYWLPARSQELCLTLELAGESGTSSLGQWKEMVGDVCSEQNRTVPASIWRGWASEKASTREQGPMILQNRTPATGMWKAPLISHNAEGIWVLYDSWSC